MDIRRKPTGHRTFEDDEKDYEAAEPRSATGHASAPRRARLSTVGLLSLGLVLVLVGAVMVMHFQHVSRLHSANPEVSLLCTTPKSSGSSVEYLI